MARPRAVASRSRRRPTPGTGIMATLETALHHAQVVAKVLGKFQASTVGPMASGFRSRSPRSKSSETLRACDEWGVSDPEDTPGLADPRRPNGDPAQLIFLH